MELTQVQREILTALINIQRQEGRAIKGDEIAAMIDRNPGTIRNQMQSLKALHLVEGVPGPKGGYRSTAAAYEVLNLAFCDEVVDVPVTKNGSLVEGATVNEIVLTTIMNPKKCTGMAQIIGNIREFNVGDEIELGPTPVNKVYISGKISGRDDTSNRLIFDIYDIVSVPKTPVRSVARPAITVTSETSLREASRVMIKAGAHEALVRENGDLKGLINLVNIARAVAEDKVDLPVGEVMIKDIPTIDADDPICEAIKKINITGALQVVVIESDVPWGVVEAGDLMQSLTSF